jgi:hypothetical protein
MFRAIEDEDEDMNTPIEESKEPPIELPADRNRKLFYARTGRLPSITLPEQFYEVTQDDMNEYAKSIQSTKSDFELAKNLKSNQKRRADYKTTIIRIKLYEHLYLEGIFRATDTVNKYTTTKNINK